MRICSLLPGITDTLIALGAGAEVVAVTHECTVPPGSNARVVTSSRMAVEASSAEIDRRVREAEQGLYVLDVQTLRRLQPDVILTQKLCAVCAVDETLVHRAVEQMPAAVRVESFGPTTLAEVFAMFARIGTAVGRPNQAARFVERFRKRTAQIADCVARQPRPRVLCLEWLDPPFACGHWTPELVAQAGGAEVLGRAGAPSYRTTWATVHDAGPEVVFLAPCGYTVPQTLRELPQLESRPEWQGLPAVEAGRVYVADGSAYFNRPGPALLDSLEILAQCMHEGIVDWNERYGLVKWPDRHVGARLQGQPSGAEG
jgi:iron complex transport system substrate-binding protein